MSSSPLAEQQNPVILLVEDDYLNRSMMFQFLTKLNYRVLMATNGEDAIALAKNWKPDLVIMDIELPIRHGYDAVKEIKAWGETANIPVLCISAHVRPESREEALHIGCDDYQSKPFLLKEFEARIKYLLLNGPEPSRPSSSV